MSKYEISVNGSVVTKHPIVSAASREHAIHVWLKLNGWNIFSSSAPYGITAKAA